MSTGNSINRKLVSLFFGLVIAISAHAQDEAEGPFSFGADLESRYIWRGINLGGSSPSIQPSVAISKGGFELGFWGAYQLGASTSVVAEADWYVSYTIADVVTLGVTDYFFPVEGARNKYFSYDNDITGHVIEPFVSISSDKFPVSLMVAVNVYGADKKSDDSGDQAYSSYLEATYAKTIGGVDFSAFAGFAFGANGQFYTNEANGFTNLGIGLEKAVKITDSFELPMHAKVIVNPERENIYFVFGISL